MRPAGFEPPTRGLEVRRFIYENGGSAACSSQFWRLPRRSSYLTILRGRLSMLGVPTKMIRSRKKRE